MMSQWQPQAGIHLPTGRVALHVEHKTQVYLGCGADATDIASDAADLLLDDQLCRVSAEACK